MSDDTNEQERPRVLGKIGEGPVDRDLGAGKPSRSRRKLPEPQAPGEHTPKKIPEPSGEERVTLPRGAFVAVRKSGGLRFSSRAVAVFRNGRVRYSTQATGAGSQVGEGRRLLQDEVVALYQRVADSGLKRLPPSEGRQSPDAFAVELVARVGRKVYAAELFEPHIPASLDPLIRDLLALIPADEG
jgi:hypothetical protein